MTALPTTHHRLLAASLACLFVVAPAACDDADEGPNGSGGKGGGGGSGGAGGAPTDASDAKDTAPDGTTADGKPSVCPNLTLTPVTEPAAIRVPAGNKLALRFYAEGSQIYACRATVGAGDAGSTYAWALKAPDARLYDANGVCAQAGTHFAGPTWASGRDQSAVVGMRVADASPNSAGIPWLLLKAASTSGQGVFTGVTYIQRLDTIGGFAPANGACGVANVDQEVSVSYTAVYDFYKADGVDAGPDGGDAGKSDASDAATGDGGDAADAIDSTGDGALGLRIERQHERHDERRAGATRPPYFFT